MKDMTAEDFKSATGRMPEDDDLERVNCPVVGVFGHMSCGWNWSWNAPVFEVGTGVKPNKGGSEMKVKTSELSGAQLDWAVAKCEGVDKQDYYETHNDVYMPSTDWAQGGPIIERECIQISCIRITGYTPDKWTATHPTRFYADGPTPLIAAMRCYVASKLGEEVEIPDNL